MGPELYLYDFKAGKFQALDIRFHTSPNTLAFAGRELLLLDSSCQLTRWADGKVRQTLPTNRGFCLAVDQDEVFVGTGFGDIDVWSLKAGKRKKILHQQHKGPVYAIALSPDGKWMASGGLDGQVVFHAR
jgi:WD40 repeat protein